MFADDGAAACVRREADAHSQKGPSPFKGEVRRGMGATCVES
jgi:hypothetical protein